MDILFLSRTIPDDVDSIVRSKMINTMDDAAIAWQKHIIHGLDMVNGEPVRILNFLPVRSWPGGYREPFVKRFEFSHVNGSDDLNVSFCNIKYLKRLFQGNELYREVKKWASNNDGHKKIIIAYSLYPEFLKAIKIAKNVNSNIVSCAVVLDLPEYSILSKKINFISKVYLNWHKKKTNHLLFTVDFFSLLTAQMKDALKINKPFCITEGICSLEMPEKTSVCKEKYIFYGGTLHERFGILHLLRSFSLIKSPLIKLVICGFGDSEQEIIEASKNDKRIVFKGQLERKQALDLMVNASVIVNPRQDLEEFTKYSFPSKNIEALSSGSPFVAYKLPGIPNEYDDYINYPSDNTEECLADLLQRIVFDETGFYSKKAKQSKSWVYSQKNEIIQATKILKLLGKEG